MLRHGYIHRCNSLFMLSFFHIMSMFILISSLSSAGDTCELPSCELVLRSRLYSERCGTAPQEWPLLISATPRSATTFMASFLNFHGMKIEDDEFDPKRDGSVSWVFAFEDPHSFGKARTGGLKFGLGLHQMREPLKVLTSIFATEPIYGYSVLTSGNPVYFLERHIDFSTMHEHPRYTLRSVMQFYLNWHAFLRDMRYPTFQVELVEVESIFAAAGLSDRFIKDPPTHETDTIEQNHRGKLVPLTWTNLFTADPKMAADIWDMAHYYGYKYEDVEFDALKCGKSIKEPHQLTYDPSPFCPVGEHPLPIPHHTPTPFIDPLVGVSGRPGWVDAGCMERKQADGTFVGVPLDALFKI